MCRQHALCVRKMLVRARSCKVRARVRASHRARESRGFEAAEGLKMTFRWADIASQRRYLPDWLPTLEPAWRFWNYSANWLKSLDWLSGESMGWSWKSAEAVLFCFCWYSINFSADAIFYYYFFFLKSYRINLLGNGKLSNSDYFF